jgi:hypothetical protein
MRYLAQFLVNIAVLEHDRSLRIGFYQRLGGVEEGNDLVLLSGSAIDSGI